MSASARLGDLSPLIGLFERCAVRSRVPVSPRYDYKTCKDCGRDRDDVGLLSRQRLCASCAIKRAEQNNEQIAAGNGPFAEHRLRRTIMAAHRGLVASEQDAA